MTGRKTDGNLIWSLCGRLDDVFGIRIGSFWRTSGLELPDDIENKIERNPENGHELLQIERGEEQFKIDVDYFEGIELKGAEIYAMETNHNICAVSRNKYGKGNAYYVFSETNDVLLGWLFDQIAKEIEITPSVRTPEGVLARKIAENQTFYLNITGKECVIPLPESGNRILAEEKNISTLVLKPYDGELIVTK